MILLVIGLLVALVYIYNIFIILGILIWYLMLIKDKYTSRIIYIYIHIYMHTQTLAKTFDPILFPITQLKNA